MHIYWRIQQDLTCLGEVLLFKNPCLIREYTNWAKKKAACLAMIEGINLLESADVRLN
ncbi:MAG: hypothetical protein R6T92_00610 [Desulfosalsimonadaceae bacterium]